MKMFNKTSTKKLQGEHKQRSLDKS